MVLLESRRPFQSIGVVPGTTYQMYSGLTLLPSGGPSKGFICTGCLRLYLAMLDAPIRRRLISRPLDMTLASHKTNSRPTS